MFAMYPETSLDTTPLADEAWQVKATCLTFMSVEVFGMKLYSITRFEI